MIAEHEDKPAFPLQLPQALDDLPRCRAAVHGVAQYDDGIVGRWRDLREKSLQGHVASVDVTDGQCASRHGSSS